MLLCGFALSLLAIVAGMMLLAQTKKDNLGNLYKYVSLFVIIMAFLSLLCIGAQSIMKCHAGGRYMVRKECRMMGDDDGCMMGGYGMMGCHRGMMGGCGMYNGCCGGMMGGCCGHMGCNSMDQCHEGMGGQCQDGMNQCHQGMGGQCQDMKGCPEDKDGGSCPMMKGDMKGDMHGMMGKKDSAKKM